MSLNRKFKRARALPVPLGRPENFFTPWNYSQMLPLRCVPHDITLALPYTSYLSVIIPANTWGTRKQLIVKCGVTIKVKVPNQPGGPNYQEAYNLGGTGNVARLAVNNITAVPSQTEMYFQRLFDNDGSNWYEVNYDEASMNQSVSHPDGVNHLLSLLGGLHGFDPTIDNTLEFQIRTTWLGSTDQFLIRTAEAFIQAPYTLRRMG